MTVRLGPDNPYHDIRIVVLYCGTKTYQLPLAEPSKVLFSSRLEDLQVAVVSPVCLFESSLYAPVLACDCEYLLSLFLC